MITKSLLYETDIEGQQVAFCIGYSITDGHREVWIEDCEGCTPIEARIWLDGNESEVWAAIEERAESEALP